MKPHAIFLLIAAFWSVLAIAPAQAEKWQFGLDGFTQIKASDGLEIKITVGPKFLVFAEGRKRTLEVVDIRITGTTLVLSRIPNWKEQLFPWLHDTAKVTVTISLPEIQRLEADSGSSVAMSGSITQPLTISARSGVAMSIKDVDGAKLEIDVASGAVVSVIGTCSSITAIASSGAVLDAGGLICRTATAEAQSGGNLVIYGNETLSVSASSGGNLVAKGGGTVIRAETHAGGNLVIKP